MPRRGAHEPKWRHSPLNKRPGGCRSGHRQHSNNPLKDFVFLPPFVRGIFRGADTSSPIAIRTHILARFFQNFSRLSVPPNNVVKMVESTSKMFPARSPFGGIQTQELNSVLPAAVNGCGRSRSIGWRVKTWTDFVSSAVRA